MKDNKLTRLAIDKVMLIKQNRQEILGINALIQGDTILIPDPSVPLEENDCLKRILPSGLIEIYQVIDRGFISVAGGNESYYQAKVKKIENLDLVLQMKRSVDPRAIFVVHGRNILARNAMFQFLRSIGLKPIEWSQAIMMTGKPSPYVGEILTSAFHFAQAVIVLFTGDDEAKLKNNFLIEADGSHERELTPQARANVLFEAGMAFGSYPNRTILVEIGIVRPFSDIAGRHVIHLNNSSERRQELAQRLLLAGCLVDISGTDWHNVGDFDNSIL